jgi:hypothetical protein
MIEKEVYLFSSMHDESSTEVPKFGRHSWDGEVVLKWPNCVITGTYNHNMGCIDCLDQVFIYIINNLLVVPCKYIFL